jgi:hypothetical protein
MNRLTFLAAAASFGVFSSAAMAQEAPKFFFEGDAVRGAGPTAKGPGCVLNSQFKRGETIVFRIRLRDPSGKEIDEKGIKEMRLEMSNGKSNPFVFHGHPPKDSVDWFWVSPLALTDDMPTGSFSYKVVVTGLDGKETTWAPFKVKPSQMTIAEN